MLTNVVVALFGDSAGVLSSNSLWDGDIGADILRRYVVFFDYRANRMIRGPHAGTSEPFEADIFDQGPRDARVFGVVITTMLTVAVAASLIPAARAARLDPKSALQAD